MELILVTQSIGDVTKYEIYTAIALITIILISVLWREELEYRRQNRVEVKTIIVPHPLPDSTHKGYLGKRKLNPKYWNKKYEDNLKFYSLASNGV